MLRTPKIHPGDDISEFKDIITGCGILYPVGGVVSNVARVMKCSSGPLRGCDYQALKCNVVFLVSRAARAAGKESVKKTVIFERFERFFNPIFKRSKPTHHGIENGLLPDIDSHMG